MTLAAYSVFFLIMSCLPCSCLSFVLLLLCFVASVCSAFIGFGNCIILETVSYPSVFILINMFMLLQLSLVVHQFTEFGTLYGFALFLTYMVKLSFKHPIPVKTSLPFVMFFQCCFTTCHSVGFHAKTCSKVVYSCSVLLLVY